MPRYRVVGNNEVLGHEPGESFEADLDAVQERRLIAGGHIVRVGRSKSPVAHNGGQHRHLTPPPDDQGAPDDRARSEGAPDDPREGSDT